LPNAQDDKINELKNVTTCELLCLSVDQRHLLAQGILAAGYDRSVEGTDWARMLELLLTRMPANTSISKIGLFTMSLFSILRARVFAGVPALEITRARRAFIRLLAYALPLCARVAMEASDKGDSLIVFARL
jgi:hypothetical protein